VYKTLRDNMTLQYKIIETIIKRNQVKLDVRVKTNSNVTILRIHTQYQLVTNSIEYGTALIRQVQYKNL